jgi:hypothetical protein
VIGGAEEAGAFGQCIDVVVRGRTASAMTCQGRVPATFVQVWPPFWEWNRGGWYGWLRMIEDLRAA